MQCTGLSAGPSQLKSWLDVQFLERGGRKFGLDPNEYRTCGFNFMFNSGMGFLDFPGLGFAVIATWVDVHSKLMFSRKYGECDSG